MDVLDFERMLEEDELDIIDKYSKRLYDGSKRITYEVESQVAREDYGRHWLVILKVDRQGKVISHEEENVSRNGILNLYNSYFGKKPNSSFDKNLPILYLNSG